MTRIMKLKYRQRMHKIRRNMILSITSMILIIMLTLSVNVFKSFARDDSPVFYKYFTSIVVGSDDTLSSIAMEHNMKSEQSDLQYIREVMHINHLEDDEIISGQHLIIPYYSGEFKGNL